MPLHTNSYRVEVQGIDWIYIIPISVAFEREVFILLWVI